jgi:hypothetical protein
MSPIVNDASWIGDRLDRCLRVRLWPDEKSGPFKLEAWFAAVGGMVRLVGMCLASVESLEVDQPPRPVLMGRRGLDGEPFPRQRHRMVPEPFKPVTAPAWRGVLFDDVVAGMRDQLTEHFALLSGAYVGEPDNPLAEWIAAHADEYSAQALAFERSRPGPGRRPERDAAFYRRVAEIVTRERAAGRGGRVLQALQSELGGTRGQANHWRIQAQRRGLLPPPVPRKHAAAKSTKRAAARKGAK